MPRSEFLEVGYPVYGANGIIGYADRFTHEVETILIGCRGTIGAVHVATGRFLATGNTMALDYLKNDKVDVAYLAHYLRWRGLADVTSGSSQPQLTRRNLLSVTVPLPRLDEQQRIAAVLDRVIGIGAVRVAQLATFEGLAAEVFNGVFVSARTTRPLGDVANFIRGITFKPEDKVAPGPESVAVMRTKNVQKTLDRRDEIHVPLTLIRKESQFLQVGDILISSANSWNLVGKGCFIDELVAPAVVGGFVTALRPGPEIDSKYLYRWFLSRRTQTTMRSFSTQTTNIANLNLKRCATLSVPFLPMSEQQEFAKRATVIDRQATRIRESIGTTERLRASVARRAFSSHV